MLQSQIQQTITNNIINFVNLAKSSAFIIIISKISRIFKILILIRRHKQKAVEQTRDNDSINQFLIELKNCLKETFLLNKNVQIALMIDIIEFIIQ